MNLRSGKVLPEPQRSLQQKEPKEKGPTIKGNSAQDDTQDQPVLGMKGSSKVDYNIVAHLKRIPALLSVYDALLLVRELRQALIKA